MKDNKPLCNTCIHKDVCYMRWQVGDLHDPWLCNMEAVRCRKYKQG